MREAYPPHARWHKSSHSHSSASGPCVEVAPVVRALTPGSRVSPPGPRS
jgi:hypothetical protein